MDENKYLDLDGLKKYDELLKNYLKDSLADAFGDDFIKEVESAAN